MINTSMGQRLEQRPELRQHLAPRMIHSMEILQMPVQALQERIEQELNENPVLERRDAAEEGQEGESQPEEPGPAEEFDPDGVLVHDPDNQADFNRLDALNRDWDDLFNEEHRPSRAGLAEEGDRKHDAMQNMPARPMSLQEYLEDQVGFLEITPEQERLVRFVIGHIDRSGYLGERYLDERDQEHLRLLTCSELARRYDGAVTADEVEEALLLVQKLDPPGVGARDLKECLLLQLQPDTPHRDVVRALILHHLEDIQHNRLPVIQKKTGFDLPVVKEAIDILARFDPEPGSRFDSAQTQYVVPDLLVERTDSGDYEVRLTDEWMPSLRISRSYYQMARDKAADPKTKDYLRRKILSAQWLLEAIDQRRNTLLKVTRAIIDRQRAFLDKGPEYIEPLKMQQIADQVGVHVTTVSRAVDDKWVQTPRGVFPLKRFFGGGAKTASGEEVAWETIKQKLLELIEKEDKSNPLSDEDLVTKLNEAGYPVARRTVTKYRKMLRIPSSRQRKAW